MRKKSYSFEKNSGNDINIVANRQKRKSFEILSRVLCLVLAVIFWLGVMYFNRSEFEVTIEDVPVELTGLEKIQAEYGLTVANREDCVVTVTIRGRKSVIEKYTSGNVKAKIDVSSLSSIGSFEEEIEMDIPVFSLITYKLDKTKITVTTCTWAPSAG